MAVMRSILEEKGFNNFNRRETYTLPADFDFPISEINQIIPENSVDYTKMTIDRLYVGQRIASSNFITGVDGWQINGNGDAEFNNITVRGTIYADFGEIGGWSIDDTRLYSDNIEIDSANEWIKSTDYVSGIFGSGFLVSADLAEFGNIRARGSIRTANFQKDVISAVAGGILISPDSATLASDVSDSDTTVTIAGGSTLLEGDSIRIKEDTEDEWMIVLDDTNAPTYGVRRDILTTTTLYSSEKVGNTSNPSIAQQAFTAVDCTGLTKANGLLKIDLKCDVPANMTTNSYVEITSSGGADVNEWYLASISTLGITTEYKTFYLPLSSFSTPGGELNVAAINFIRVFSYSSSGNITMSWRNAEIIRTSTSNYPVWTKGATVVNFGQRGQGGIFNTASEPNSPYTQYFTHDGDPWDHLNTRVRIGNLNGIAGITEDAYGFFAGDYLSNKYLSYDDVSGRIEGVNFDTVWTFTASEDLLVGQTVGPSNGIEGYVARALRYNIGVTMTSGTNYFTDNFNHDRFFYLDTDKFILLHTSNSSNSENRDIFARVVSVDRDDMTFTLGATVNPGTTRVSRMTGCRLRSDAFVVFLSNYSSAAITYYIYSVSGTTCTLRSSGSVGVNREIIECVATGDNKGVLLGYTTNNGVVIAFDVSTYTISFGSTVDVGSLIEQGAQPKIARLAEDKFILGGGDTNERIYVRAGSVSGTTITLGTEKQLTTSGTAGSSVESIISPEDNVFVICCTPDTQYFLQAGTVSGTDITTGSAITAGQYTLTAINNQIYAKSRGGSSIYTVNRSGTTLNLRIMASPLSAGALVSSPEYYLMASQPGDVAATLYITFQGMSNSFFGIAQESVARGEELKVMSSGKDQNQSNLNPGGLYKADGLGGLTFISSTTTLTTPADKYVTALSSSEIVI